jgi:hypothetical protein
MFPQLHNPRNFQRPFSRGVPYAMCAKPAPFALFSAPIFTGLFHPPSKRLANTSSNQPCPRTDQHLKVLATAISPQLMSELQLVPGGLFRGLAPLRASLSGQRQVAAAAQNKLNQKHTHSKTHALRNNAACLFEARSTQATLSTRLATRFVQTATAIYFSKNRNFARAINLRNKSPADTHHQTRHQATGSPRYRVVA